jgi:CRISPR/Cas system-associated exonuclease Cas4 (RecB family)
MKNLISEVMERPPALPKSPLDPEGLVLEIQKGYTSKRGPKFQQKKSFAPSTVAYSHGECARYWYLAFSGGVFEDDADAFAGANMTNGTKSHERIQQAMADADILLDSEFKVISNDPPIFGYGDVLLAWQGEALLGEIKTMMNEGFEYRKINRKPKTGHLVQLLIYMKILNKKKSVLIYENKNNHELLVLPVEMTEYYQKWVDEAFEWMRAVRKTWEDEVLPIKNYRSNSKICKTCPLSKVCADAGKGEVKMKALEPIDEKLSMV